MKKEKSQLEIEEFVASFPTQDYAQIIRAIEVLIEWVTKEEAISKPEIPE